MDKLFTVYYILKSINHHGVLFLEPLFLHFDEFFVMGFVQIIKL